jgi:hypothetical protein
MALDLLEFVGNLHEYLHHGWIELETFLSLDFFQGFLMAPGFFIRSYGGQGVVNIGDTLDPGAQGDLITF